MRFEITHTIKASDYTAGGFNFEVHNDVSGSSRLKDVLWS